MRTRIISAFPGTGKSHFVKNNTKYKCLDSDSSDYSWITIDGKKERNPDFPQNYIQHIKDNIGKVDFIFVSSHEEVRNSLQQNCIFFYLFYPNKNIKEIYLKRYKERGSPESFINLLDENWSNWIKSCEFASTGCRAIRMAFLFLDKEIEHLIASEGSDKL